MPIFNHAHPKIIEAIFCFPEFAQALKDLLTPSVHSWDTESFSLLESYNQTGHTHIWPHPPKKSFDQLLIYLNLYQHAKNQVVSFICSGDMID